MNPRTEGCQLPGVPEDMVNVGLAWRQPLPGDRLLSTSIDTRYVSKVYSTDDNADVEGGYGRTEAFTVTDFRIAYHVKGSDGYRYQFAFNVDNVFDHDYYQYYLSPGRTFSGEFTMKW